MAKHCVFRYGFGTLLILSWLAASVSGSDFLGSSGRRSRVTEKERVNADDFESVKAVRERRDAGLQAVKSNSTIHFSYFHVNSAVYAHFAKVTIDSEVTNTADNESQEVTFEVGVPGDAFLLSNFTVFVDEDKNMGQHTNKSMVQLSPHSGPERNHDCQPESKEELGGGDADDWYQEARERGRTAGRIDHRRDGNLERGMELYTISLFLAPGGNASFTLAYVELLERRDGMYTQTLMVQPGAVVDDLLVTAKFTEQQEFTHFAYTLPGSDDKLTSGSAENQTEIKAGVNSRELVFRPSVEMQRQFDSKRGIQGVLTIHYSLNTPPGGGSIIVQKDNFVHSFALKQLPILPKNILFIIDISGSMKGVKIQQARQAMLKILTDLKSRATDTFNIMLFDHTIDIWKKSPAQSSVSEIESAKKFVRDNLIEKGGTDIHQALIKGLTVLLKNEVGRSCDKINMIIFLTDGDPQNGITNTDQIIREVTSKNNNRTSIFSLGFGFDLKFDFLNKISVNNYGFVRRIDVNKDAKDQLRMFYREISSPVMCDVVVSYSKGLVNTNLLTRHDFPSYFEGKEILVAGKTIIAKAPSDSFTWDAKVTGTGPNGSVSFKVPAGQVKMVSDSHIEEDQLEKMWAYKKIKSLFRQLDLLDSEEDKIRICSDALNLSLTYDFVTPSTSLSMEVDSIQEKRRRRQGPPGQAWTPTWSWGMVCCLLMGLLILQ